MRRIHSGSAGRSEEASVRLGTRGLLIGGSRVFVTKGFHAVGIALHA
jgi:hypothetical protein